MKLKDLVRFLGADDRNREKIDEASALRRRLSYLRVPDAEVAKAAEYLSLAAGDYVAACTDRKLYDPRANDALADALAVLDGFLRELDETATEKRFDLPDANPFPAARQRTLAALAEDARTVKEAAFQISGGLSAADSMDIREELK